MQIFKYLILFLFFNLNQNSYGKNVLFFSELPPLNEKENAKILNNIELEKQNIPSETTKTKTIEKPADAQISKDEINAIKQSREELNKSISDDKKNIELNKQEIENTKLQIENEKKQIKSQIDDLKSDQNSDKTDSGIKVEKSSNLNVTPNKEEVYIVKNKYFKLREKEAPSVEKVEKQFYSPALPKDNAVDQNGKEEKKKDVELMFEDSIGKKKNVELMLEDNLDRKYTERKKEEQSEPFGKKIDKLLAYLMKSDNERHGTIYGDVNVNFDIFNSLQYSINASDRLNIVNSIPRDTFKASYSDVPLLFSLSIGKNFSNYVRTELQFFDIEFIKNSSSKYTAILTKDDADKAITYDYDNTFSGIQKVVGLMGNVMIDTDRTRRLFASAGGGVGFGNFVFRNSNIHDAIGLAYNVAFQINLRLSKNLIIYGQYKYIGFPEFNTTLSNPTRTLAEGQSLSENKANIDSFGIHTVGGGIRLYFY